MIAQVKQIVGDMPVYLTFDIDCLDPAFAPGTGTPVIGGLTSDRAIKLVRGLKDLNIVGWTWWKSPRPTIVRNYRSGGGDPGAGDAVHPGRRKGRINLFPSYCKLHRRGQ